MIGIYFHNQQSGNALIAKTICVHLQITDEVFDGVTVRVYKPKKKNTKLPGLMYYHGGGWVIMNIS